MLDGLFMVLALSMVMAIASFLAGLLPLSFPLSPPRLRIITTMGMGVLVGTALIVIIPEGVDTLYSASDASGSLHARRDLLSGSQNFRPSPEYLYFSRRNPLSKRDDYSEINNHTDLPVIHSEATSSADQTPPSTPTAVNDVHILDSTSLASIPPSSRTPHVWIGLSLIFGFILMFLLDTFSSPSPPRSPTSNIYSLSDLSSSPPPPPPSRTVSTTLGLCIHAAADGIALGASTHSTTSLSLVIFVAIMVHKAPSAFGLTSVLLKQGLGKRGARAHLVVFSLAAPVGALGTWLVVRTLGGGGEEEVMRWWTGVLLLFSGGTFLYVAMHSMQEPESTNPFSGMEPEPLNGGSNVYLDHPRAQHRLQREGKSLKLVLVAVIGMLMPLITQIGHAH